MNYFQDTPEIKMHLADPLMERIAELRENAYADARTYDWAPKDYADAQECYSRILDLAGEVCAEMIAPNAESIDKEGPSCAGGRVTYAAGTRLDMQAMRQAGFTGVALPRQYGGLNMPFTVFSAISEMVSRADAGFQNVWGLQSCADTINEFGSDEQKEKFLTMVCQGSSMSMDLTEPDAGSDLQSVMLRATEDPATGQWRLNGVKRFITNGDSDIHLVLARSEEGTRDGRGLSLFIYDKRDGGVNVRRIEDKMGIHGSPTCELVFNNAPAELCGARRMGLIKYVMSLMNGARLGIATQCTGLLDAAWREASAYAKERRQFGQAIEEFPAVWQMLSLMEARTSAVRSLLYETARYVDIYKGTDAVSKTRALTLEERQEAKRYSRLADALTPLVKGISSELANRSAYDCIQIHGGSGFMRDYACERIYRDARITSIYEGTTQLQVVAALRCITGGTYATYVRELLLETPNGRVEKMVANLEAATAHVTETKDAEYIDFCGRRLMESAAYTVMTALLARDCARAPELLSSKLAVWTDFAAAEVSGHTAFILESSPETIKAYRS